jgi:hypothetical protein
MSQSITLKGISKVPGAQTVQNVSWTGDNSYPNPAGYVVTPALVGLTRFKGTPKVIPATAAALAWDYAFVPTFDATSDYITQYAIHLAVSTTGVEVANGVNVTAAALLIDFEGN